MTREEFKKIIFEASKEDKSSPKNFIHLLTLHGYIKKLFSHFEVKETLYEAHLKAKDEEIALLKKCVEEAIKRPMGVEPSIYSDYKMSKEML